MAAPRVEPGDSSGRSQAAHHPRGKSSGVHRPSETDTRAHFLFHNYIQPPYMLFFSLFMICAGLTLPRTSGAFATPLSSFPQVPRADSDNLGWLGAHADYSLFYYFLLWIALVVVSTAFIFIHGIDYVNWPRLLPPTDIIYYDGPGFRSAHHGKGLGLPALEKAVTAGVGEKEHRRARSKKLDEIEMGSIPAKEHFD